MYFDSNFTEVPNGPIGLAPNRRQAITWTNADPVHWRTYAALEGLSEAMSHVSIESRITSQIWDERFKFYNRCEICWAKFQAVF